MRKKIPTYRQYETMVFCVFHSKSIPAINRKVYH